MLVEQTKTLGPTWEKAKAQTEVSKFYSNDLKIDAE